VIAMMMNIPAKAGSVGATGRSPLHPSWIPGRASYRQLARNDD
jgi:hypothetical protein